MSSSVRFHAPAKINLRLKVTGRRADGMHLLSMLNIPLTLSDELEVEFQPGGGLFLEVLDQGQSVPAGPANLVSRAVEAFEQSFGVAVHCRVRLVKHIPVAAGLGGGSSDAAGMLRLLADVYRAALEKRGFNSEGVKAGLSAAALVLGADVPYFLQPQFGFLRGIGEEIRYLDPKPLAQLTPILLIPPVGIRTPDIFSLCRNQVADEEFRPDRQAEQLAAEWDKLAGQADNHGALRQKLAVAIENDLEPFINQHAPSVAALLREIRALPGVQGCPSGSGSALFVVPAGLGAWREEDLDALAGIARDGGARLLQTAVFAE